MIDCVDEMLTVNQDLLKSEVDTRFLKLIRDALMNQHRNTLDGSRFGDLCCLSHSDLCCLSQ